MLYKSIEFKAEEIDLKKNQITGYAATWDLDQGSDVIHKGAFKKTIAENLKRIKVLRNHKDLIGKPLHLEEDSVGLIAVSHISQTTLGKDTMILAEDGALDRKSIGYSIPANKSDIDQKGVRHIHEIKLFEYSMVDFPMNESAIITGVKDMQGAMRDALTMGRIEQKDLQQVQELLKDLTTLLTVGEPPKKHSLEDNQPSELEQLSAVLSNFKL